MKFSKLKGKLPEAEGALPPEEMLSETEAAAEVPTAPKAPAALAALSDDELLAELERRQLLEGSDELAGPAPEMEV